MIKIKTRLNKTDKEDLYILPDRKDDIISIINTQSPDIQIYQRPAYNYINYNNSINI